MAVATVAAAMMLVLSPEQVARELLGEAPVLARVSEVCPALELLLQPPGL
jgi:hypothetical protein